MKFLYILLIAFLFVPTAFSADSVYITNQNILTNGTNYKVIFNENITLKEIDSLNIYISTENYFYILEKSSGTIMYKYPIEKIYEIKLSNNFVHVNNGKYAYSISKIYGTILNKQESRYGSIFSYSDASGTWDVNNTNLAPNVAGHPPGTGERIASSLYWANDSDIQIFVFGHASTASQALNITLEVNNATVETSELRPLGVAENTHAYVTAIIPKGSNYSVTVKNFHHYEWREWKLTMPGSTTINVSSCSDCVNSSQLNEKVNKSGDIMTGDLEMQGGNVNMSHGSVIGNINSGIYILFQYGFFGDKRRVDTHVESGIDDYVNQSIEFDRYDLLHGVGGDTANRFLIDKNKIAFSRYGVEKLNITNNSIIIKTDLNMSGFNITNCGNCTFGSSPSLGNISNTTSHGLARAYLSGNQLNLANGVPTLVTLNTASFDPYSELFVSTNNYTAPVDGYYDVKSSITFIGTTAAKQYINSLYVNDVAKNFVTGHTALAGGISIYNTDIIYMNQGDVLSLFAQSLDGTNNADIQGFTTTTWMAVRLVSS